MATSPHLLSAKPNKGKAADTDALFQIRFNDNQPDLTLYLALEATVAQFKTKIAIRRPVVRDKQLRLIFGGQLLNDDHTLLQYSKLKQRTESQISQRARPDSTSQSADAENVDDSPIFIHCSVSERTETSTANSAPAGQVSHMDHGNVLTHYLKNELFWCGLAVHINQLLHYYTSFYCVITKTPVKRNLRYEPPTQPITTEPPLAGFDRLREAGFSEEDINNFRQQFHLFRGNNADADPNQIRNLEEEWMDNGGPEVHAEGGLLSIFWYKENMTQRHQVGLITGVILNFIFGFLKEMY
ncbi:hypothetical protein IWQ61_000666 [Dispira simplex]|nr:hypothetical protein IWQ61_000666 [Dispira simplex]